MEGFLLPLPFGLDLGIGNFGFFLDIMNSVAQVCGVGVGVMAGGQLAWRRWSSAPDGLLDFEKFSPLSYFVFGDWLFPKTTCIEMIVVLFLVFRFGVTVDDV